MVETTRTPQRTAQRREDILATARTLFDAEGIAQVTTGRIAQVAGISPGNLYYWFANKGEIVRALFAQWSAASALEVGTDDDPEQVLRTLWGQTSVQREVSDRFGFFARELFPLLHVDPVLAEQYRANVIGRSARLGELVETMIDADLLRRPEPPTTVADLVAVTWLVQETAAPFAAAVGADVLDPRTAPLVAVLPLLTARGRQVLGLGHDGVAR
ncbi:MAG: TetR/AcrR family transcriptional regulator [Actinobacteria bacterium]|nr:TetR/AcrR family transcriptional regulator [Actinomycetota bacterium]MCG2799617.1 TetR/AcrR family transcriptional regulator [Cellulomonas sp.]